MRDITVTKVDPDRWHVEFSKPVWLYDYCGRMSAWYVEIREGCKGYPRDNLGILQWGLWVISMQDEWEKENGQRSSNREGA